MEKGQFSIPLPPLPRIPPFPYSPPIPNPISGCPCMASPIRPFVRERKCRASAGPRRDRDPRSSPTLEYSLATPLSPSHLFRWPTRCVGRALAKLALGFTIALRSCQYQFAPPLQDKVTNGYFCISLSLPLPRPAVCPFSRYPNTPFRLGSVLLERALCPMLHAPKPHYAPALEIRLALQHSIATRRFDRIHAMTCLTPCAWLRFDMV